MAVVAGNAAAGVTINLKHTGGYPQAPPGAGATSMVFARRSLVVFCLFLLLTALALRLNVNFASDAALLYSAPQVTYR